MATPPEYRSAQEEEGATLRDYLGVIWRRKWIIMLVIVVATTAAYFFCAPGQGVRGAGRPHLREAARRRQPAHRRRPTSTRRARPRDHLGRRHHPEPRHAERADAILEEKDVDDRRLRGPLGDAQTQRDRHPGGATSCSVIGDSEDPETRRGRRQRLRGRRSSTGARSASRSQIEAADDVGQGELASTRGRPGDRRLPHAQAAPQRPPHPQGHRQRQLPRAGAGHGAQAPYRAQPVRSAILGFGVGLLRRHRPRLPARAVRHAPAPARGDRRRCCASPSSGASRASSRKQITRHSGHAGAPGRPRRRGVPHGAHQPRLHGRRQRRAKSMARHQLRAGRGQERRRRQPRRHHGPGRQEGRRRRRRPAAAAPAQVLPADNEAGLSTVIAGEADLRDSLAPVDVQPPDDGQETQDFAPGARARTPAHACTCSPAGRSRPTPARSSPPGASPT